MIRRTRIRRPVGRARGQALAEFAVVFPIAMLVIFGIIVLGLWVFYQQQITNVAREGARFAAIHSSTAICPTSSWRDPQAPPSSYAIKPFNCDGPDNPADSYPWPEMTAHARTFAWGLSPSAVHINACWSGYRPYGASSATNADFPAQELISGSMVAHEFIQCTIAGTNPETNSQALGCGPRMTTLSDDPASDKADNQVTVYACFRWSPPLAGILMIPSTITMKAVISEVIHRQQ
jgi:hypothetical protein